MSRPNDAAPWIAKQRLEARAANRLAAHRYSANILAWEELMGWLYKYCPTECRAGRVNGELIVTQEAFDNIPGDEIKAFENPLGQSVWRKKFEVPGTPTFTLSITMLEDS